MTRPRYCCLFSTTTKSSKQFFFSQNLHEESVWLATLKWTLLFLASRDKKLPGIQKHVPNPKRLLLWDVFMDSGKCFWILGSVFGFWDVFLDYGKCFGFWDVFCAYKPRIDVIWKQTNNNKLECLRIQQWVISSIQYFLVQVITLSLYSLFFQPYLF